MCGIVGYSGKYHESKISLALESLRHRGPDDSGLIVDKSAGYGLGHARLSIIDLSSTGHQPMCSGDRSVNIIFNGEIYNYRSLRHELEKRGHVFAGHSDTEVLLNLYLEYKREKSDISKMLRRLNGIFAFALWDAQEEAVLVVRDAFGVKPIYYSKTESGVAFASEIKGLLHFISDNCSTGDCITRRLDASAINRYISYLWCPGDGTPFKEVRKIAPGEAMWLRNGLIKNRWTWYQLPAFSKQKQIINKDEVISGLEEKIRNAVHRQMVSDVPVGAFLSGGLDSSSVVAFARELNHGIRCFTIDTFGSKREGFADDLPYARRVAAHLNVPLDIVRVDAAQMVRDLPTMVAQLDEPLGDPAPLNVLYISRLAREQGIKVLLSGAGGDDLFTGYRRHRALMSEYCWSWMPVNVRILVERLTKGLDQRKTVFRRLRKLFSGAALDSERRLVNYFRWVDQADITALYTREFLEALNGSSAEEPMLDFLAELPPTTHRLEKMLALEQRFFLSDHNLLYSDKMSMAAGVEVRVPFLDNDLVEFAARIPPNLKQRGGEGKWVLKRVMEPYLPRDVIYRPKSGFGVPLRSWMRFELRGLMDDLLSEPSLRKRGVFNAISVQRMIKANDLGVIDASYTLLSLMCIEIWCRKFVDNKPDSVIGGCCFEK